MNEIITYLVFSDVHFGHRRTSTLEIIKHLDQMFSSHKKWAKDLDIIYIAGDLFDRRLDIGSTDAVLSIGFLLKLVKYCSKNNIKLRILEGTPDHDVQAASMVAMIVDKLNLDIDFKYIDVLHIEYIEDFDRHILYLPDKWDTPDNTYSQIKAMLKKHNISMVDTVIMHGQFGFQIPYAELPSSHDEANFTKITRGLIHAGHIHNHTNKGKIVNQGSFDRLAHGEEEDKGALLVTGDKDKYSWEFIVNKHAKIYKTIDIDTVIPNDIFKYVDKVVVGVPEGSYIRFKVPMGSPIPTMMKELRNRHIRLNLSYKYDGENEDKKGVILNLVKPDIKNSHSIQITPDNIDRILWDKISDNGLSKKRFDLELKTVT